MHIFPIPKEEEEDGMHIEIIVILIIWNIPLLTSHQRMETNSRVFFFFHE